MRCRSDAHDPVTAPGQGGVWGLGRVAALEQPALWGGLVDLPESLDARTARWFAAAVSNTSGEDQIAVRSSGWYGRRLVHAPVRSGGSPSWTTSGTALITGGTGGLGAYVARWLVERGAEHLVLLSRRGLDAEGADKLRLELELEVAGARVSVVACDVADRQALAGVLADIPEEWPLRTVVHAAGVLSDSTELASMTPEQLERQLRAKVDGARNLDELTREADLDAFVLFSSGAAAWGSGGQAGYAAGNAYLDALAVYRRAQGLKATSVAWGSWDEAGMLIGLRADERDRLDLLGVVPMRPQLAITALQRVLHEDETTIVVADMDWAKFAPIFTAARPSPLLSELPEVTQALDDFEGLGRQLDLVDLVRDCSRCRAGLCLKLTDRRGPAVQGAGLRLADGSRAAQPSAVQDRGKPARQSGVRLPDRYPVGGLSGG